MTFPLPIISPSIEQIPVWDNSIYRQNWSSVLSFPLDLTANIGAPSGKRRVIVFAIWATGYYTGNASYSFQINGQPALVYEWSMSAGSWGDDVMFVIAEVPEGTTARLTGSSSHAREGFASAWRLDGLRSATPTEFKYTGTSSVSTKSLVATTEENGVGIIIGGQRNNGTAPTLTGGTRMAVWSGSPGNVYQSVLAGWFQNVNGGNVSLSVTNTRTIGSVSFR